MGTVAKQGSLGRWYSRQAPLLIDERVVLATGAFDVGSHWLMRSPWPGILHLTNKRLVYTPGGLLYPISETELHQITDVEVVELLPFIGALGPYCSLRIKAGKQRFEFAFFGRLKSQRNQANEWEKAIREWSAKP